MIRILKNAFLIIILVHSVTFVFSQTNPDMKPLTDVEGFRSKLQKASETTNTIQSDFHQEKHLDIISEVVLSNGTFVFKKENNLRWQYTDPFDYIIVINGKEMLIKDENKVSKYDMESNKIFSQINQMMIGTVNGDILNNKDFKFEYFENSEEYFVKMTPQKIEMTEFLAGINIFLSKKDLSVNRILMNESSSDYTEIQFLNKRINAPVKDDLFKL